MKNWVTRITIGLIFIIAIYAAIVMSSKGPTYDGTKAAVSVYELQQDPSSYDVSGADGAAAVIVQENLQETRAVNDVTSIVFDFRGYDTMGESFILILTISGVIVLLSDSKAGKKQKKEEDHEDK